MANIQELAEAIYNDLAPWERDLYTLDDVIKDLTSNPLDVIQYLVDRFIQE